MKVEAFLPWNCRNWTRWCRVYLECFYITVRTDKNWVTCSEIVEVGRFVTCFSCTVPCHINSGTLIDYIHVYFGGISNLQTCTCSYSLQVHLFGLFNVLFHFFLIIWNFSNMPSAQCNVKVPAIWDKHFIPRWKHRIVCWVIRSHKCPCHIIWVICWWAKRSSWSIQTWVICPTWSSCLQLHYPVFRLWIMAHIKHSFRAICKAVT